MCRTKKKNIKSCMGKGQVIYKGRPIRITSDFSTETLKPRSWADVIQTLREQNVSQGYYNQQNYQLSTWFSSLLNDRFEHWKTFELSIGIVLGVIYKTLISANPMTLFPTIIPSILKAQREPPLICWAKQFSKLC